MALVTIQQASVKSLATYMRANLPTNISIEDRWPDPNKKFKDPTITILCAGPRIDIPINLRQLSFQNVGANRVITTWQIAACEQRLQLDVWSTNSIARDDILARLDDILNYESRDGAGHGLAIQVGDGWANTFADFYFDSPDLIDEGYTANVYEYRAKVAGHLFVNLTVNRETARQTTITFKQRVSETDPTAVPYDTKVIT